MPRRRLSKITIAPSAKKLAAVTISAVRTLNAALPSLPSDMLPPLMKAGAAAPAATAAFRLLAGDELRRLHERNVPRFLARDPVRVLLAFERGLVERTALHQVLPLRGRLHLAEQLDVVGHLGGRHAARHED